VAQKKWYSYFVVTDDRGTSADPAAVEVPPRRVSDVVPAAAVEAPATFDVAEGPRGDVSVVYESAKIDPPSHGYTVLKVADMLQSEHIRALPPDVKRKSVLVALDAAGVKIEDIVEDAVRRDRALDTYERVLEKHLEEARARTAAETQQIEAEIARVMADLKGRIEAARRQVEQEEREFQAWRAVKHREEEIIAQAVSYFVSENPITTSGSATPKGDADVR